MSSFAAPRPSFDALVFRRVLGHYPTGVCVVTAIADGRPVGMAVGSFTSVSLDPPLVAFLPDKSSSSFPKIRTAGAFCVNVLASDQEDVCRALAAKVEDKFQGIAWAPGPSGSPILDGAVAWIDCGIDSVTEAGDHFIVIGRVRELDVHHGQLPLLFFHGGYGSFTQPSRTAAPESDLLSALRLADVARSPMVQLADELDVEVLAHSLVGTDMVIIAGAGEPRGSTEPTRLGLRIPHVAPIGAVFTAWSEPADVDAWLDRAPGGQERRALLRAGLERVRERGWSLALDHPAFHNIDSAVFQSADPSPEALAAVIEAYEPEELSGSVHPNNLMVPVRDRAGEVVLAFALYGLPPALDAKKLEHFAERLMAVAAAVSAALPPN